MTHEAVQKLNSLFANGNIKTSDFYCAICDNDAPIHKHHENYEIWYSFIPLCPECHGKVRKRGKHIKFNRGTIEDLTILKDTGERISGHIVWLAKDENNNKYKIRIYAGKIIMRVRVKNYI